MVKDLSFDHKIKACTAHLPFFIHVNILANTLQQLLEMMSTLIRKLSFFFIGSSTEFIKTLSQYCYQLNTY